MFSPPGRLSVSMRNSNPQRHVSRSLTANNDILCPVQDLDRAIRMPHSQVARVKNTTGEELLRRFRILVIALGADVPGEHNFSNLLAVFLHVYDDIICLLSFNDPYRQTRHETM